LLQHSTISFALPVLFLLSLGVVIHYQKVILFHTYYVRWCVLIWTLYELCR